MRPLKWRHAWWELGKMRKTYSSRPTWIHFTLSLKSRALRAAPALSFDHFPVDLNINQPSIYALLWGEGSWRPKFIQHVSQSYSSHQLILPKRGMCVSNAYLRIRSTHFVVVLQCPKTNQFLVKLSKFWFWPISKMGKIGNVEFFECKRKFLNKGLNRFGPLY